MANRAVYLVITYRVVKLLVTPFEKQEAFKYVIIDKDGKVLRKYRTLKGTKEKQSYTVLHRFIFNLKRILKRVGLGGKLGTFAVALGLLLREDNRYVEHKSLIESAVITYLKDTKQYDDLLNEQGEVISTNEEPVGNYFGVDVYEVDNKLISENEYAKTL